MLPVPVPSEVTVRTGSGSSWKSAVTCLVVLIVSVQVVALPLHAPVQPVNCEPGFAAAVNVTTVFGAKGSAQLPGHRSTPGSDVTTPVPVPCIVTDTCG